MNPTKILTTNLSLIEGHSAAKKQLIQSFGKGDCSVYLLVGPPHVGKSLMARIIAASVHGLKEIQRPHMDTLVFNEVLEINSDEGEKRWKKSVNSLIHFVNLSPAISTSRVVVIEDIDRLSSQAANALLKTLEEPPPQAMIILTAQEIGSVLPTIQSRAQIIRLNYITDDEIRGYLKNKASSNVDEIALLANGAIGIVKQLLADSELLKCKITYIESFRIILKGEVADSLDIANIRDREQALELLSVWINLARRLLLADLYGKPDALLRSFDNLYNRKKLAHLLDRLRDIIESLHSGANVRIALESLVLDWAWNIKQMI